MLCFLAATASTAVMCPAQSAKAESSAGSYIIKLKTPQADTADEAAIRAHNVVPAAAYWDNLYNVGKVALLGSAKDGETMYRVVIVEGVNEDEARTIAESDPNVKAGAVTAEVIPFRVNLAKNSQSHAARARR